MREPEIRHALLGYLKAHQRGSSSYLAVDELNVCNGLSRVDLALVRDDTLAGYEIKSRVDSLKRLEGQLSDYTLVFDHLTIVTGVNHLTGVLGNIPTWCGVLLASHSRGAVDIELFRQSQNNPHRDSYAIAQFLWRNEALDVLTRHKVVKGVKSKPKPILWKRLAESLCLETLASEVRKALKQRPVEWRAGRKEAWSRGPTGADRLDLDTFLKEAGDSGEYDSVGVFTLSEREALKKLSRFQLPQPECWTVKVLQAAVAGGAESFEILERKRGLLFEFSISAELSSQDFVQNLCSLKETASPFCQHLVAGLRSVGFGQAREFTVHIEHQQNNFFLTWDNESLEQHGEHLVMSGTKAQIRIGVAFPFSASSGPFKKTQGTTSRIEVREFTRRAEVCPIKVTMNGSRVDTLAGPLLDPGHGLGTRIVLGLAWMPFTPELKLPELQLPSGILHPETGFHFSDRFTDKRIFWVDGDTECLKVQCMIKLSFGFHVGSHRATTTRFTCHSKPRHSQIHWVKDGVIIDSHRWRNEPTGASFDIYLSAEGLPTDISGLTIPRRADVAQRIKLVLPTVSLQAERVAARIRERIPRPFGYHTVTAGFFGAFALLLPSVALLPLLSGGVATLNLALSMYDKRELMLDASRQLERLARETRERS